MSGSHGPHRRRALLRKSAGSTGTLEGFGALFCSRLRTFSGSLPDALRGALERYLGHPEHSALLGPIRSSRDADKPYWLLLPCWLDGRNAAATRPFLHDVLTAQYYLFLGIRMRDDVFDGQWKDAPASAVADRLVAEAEKVLGRHFPPRHPFWKTYRRCLRETRSGIALADALQQNVRLRPDRLLRAYSRVNSVFCIGPAAVCQRGGHPGKLAAARRFSELFSAGAQILDDVIDVEEDRGAGRTNFAASLMGVPVGGDARWEAVTRHPRDLTGLRAGLSILEHATRLIGEAFEALRPLRSADVLAYESHCRRGLDAARAEILRALLLSRADRAVTAGAGRRPR